MGGRGSMGGTRSTYRGSSTADFRRQGLNGNGQPLPDTGSGGSSGGGGGGGGGAGKTGTGSTSTGGIQTSGGGGGQGGGGVATVDKTVDQQTTDVNDQQPQLTDEQLFGMFIVSDEYKEFYKRDFKSDAAFEKAEADAYTKWLQSQNITVPPPQPEGPLDGFRRVPKIAVTEEEIAADLHAVNPHYFDLSFDKITGNNRNSRLNRRNRNNCQRCVVAAEGRARGYDVMAVNSEEGFKARTWDESTRSYSNDGADPDDIAALFVKEDGSHPTWEYSTGTSKGEIASGMEANILAWGEGARGFVGVEWEAGSAHIFSVRVIDGKVHYTDYQTNELHESLAYGTGGWKPYIDKNTPWNGVLRVDNADITADGATWMKERTNIQINAPSFNELEVHIAGKTDKEKEIWRHVWQQSVSGDSVRLTRPMAEDPETVQISILAATWVRRPD